MRDAEAREPLVRVQGASVSIETEVLLHPASLDMRPGEIVALRGPNGSGKTTLLRAVAGLVPLAAGSILVAGAAPEPRNPEFRRTLAALIGTPPLARDLTLAEHLELVALSWGELPEGAQSHAAALLDGLGIAALERRFPHELSSGQQQLFALCLTLIRPSAVLLLDEPEQRLDAERRAVLAETLLARAAAGGAVLMATHSTELATATGARTVSLPAGQR